MKQVNNVDNMKLRVIFHYFLAGILIGFLLRALFHEKTTKISLKISVRDDFIQTKAIEEIKKIRILCMLNTNPSNHLKRAVHIQQTWGKHCDKLVFASTLTDVHLNAIGFNMTDSHEFVWGKEKLMMQYVYDNFLEKFDWFYKADDDTFANIENLRFLLSAYSPENPIVFGCKLFTPKHKWGYLHGGAG